MEEILAGDASVTIDYERGGRLLSLLVGDLEVLVTPELAEDQWMGWGGFPMVPWAGRIRRGRFSFGGEDRELALSLPPHAIHGTTFRRRWERTGSGRLRCDLQPGWPFAGHAEQEIRLHPDRLELTMRVVVDEPMPVSMGWHPWFRRRLTRGGPADVDVPAERMWQRDPDGIPDGTLVDPPPGPWDDCFTGVSWPVTIAWPGALAITVSSDCDHVVVYDEQDGGLCVEPQSAPPDAHNTGTDLVVVTPGEPFERHATIAWTHLSPT